MGAKIDAKSKPAPRRRSGSVRGGQKCLRIIVKGVVLGPILGPVLRKIEKIPSEKASKNQCKIMSKFEAKGDPK